MTGHQDETWESLIGWVTRRGSGKDAVIIYCCAVKRTWLSVIFHCNCLCKALLGEEVVSVCKQMQILLFFNYKYLMG
jgi:hypothetical protein